MRQIKRICILSFGGRDIAHILFALNALPHTGWANIFKFKTTKEEEDIKNNKKIKNNQTFKST